MMEREGVIRPACASCKHQRKKCREDCVLAPFFPAEKTREFRAVHKVFGVSNVQKMIGSLGTAEERSRAAESLIWEARWRERDPVNGCWEDYKKLQDQVHVLRQIVSKWTVPVHCISDLEYGSLDLKSDFNHSDLTGVGGIDTTTVNRMNLLEQNRLQANMQGNEAGVLAYPALSVNQDFGFPDEIDSSLKTNVELMNQLEQINKALNQFIDVNPNTLDIELLCDNNWAKIS